MKSNSNRILFTKKEDGGALVEFAILLPILLLILGGIIDFGALYYNKQVLTNASREGARMGIVRQLDGDGNKIIVQESDIQETVGAYCDDHYLLRFAEDAGPIVSAPGVSTISYPSTLTVTVTYTHTFLLSPLLNLFGGEFGQTINLSAETVMRME
ncbi:putative TadE family protein [Desulfosarcina variabilis str. Montpellier]|uniref:TadE/TadG family type IV pilus assembly protein n=1 Tax=Desulfosarcina variabilis TaxID=2300 RepID=UPI003AFA6774